MDEAMIRPRYQRHSTSTAGRRRRRYDRGGSAAKSGNTLVDTIMRQLVVCVVILLVASIIKSAGTPVTNYLTVKLKDILFQDIQPASLYAEAGALAGKFGNILPGIVKKEAVKTPSKDSNGKDISGVGKEDTTAVLAEATESGKFTVPVYGVVTSPFGERIHPIRKTKEIHEGVDIDAKEGADIKAALGGEVMEQGSDKVYGNYLKLKHGGNTITVYAHCSQVLVKKGQQVKAGEVVAKVGNTGLSVGSHLHFEIWKGGKPVNPLDYVEVQV